MKSLLEAKYIPMILQNNTSSDVATQWYFYECLTDDLLNVLLHRVSSSKMEYDIAKLMEADPELESDKDIQIITEIDTIKQDDPCIYISFYEDSFRICHLTIHLCPTTLYSNSKGPIHIVNNTYYRATQRLRVKRRTNNSIVFTLGSEYKANQPGNKSKQYTGYAIQVLNNYFNPKKAKYLLKSKTRSNKHPQLNELVQKQNEAYTILGKNNLRRKTRKVRK